MPKKSPAGCSAGLASTPLRDETPRSLELSLETQEQNVFISPFVLTAELYPLPDYILKRLLTGIFPSIYISFGLHWYSGKLLSLSYWKSHTLVVT